MPPTASSEPTWNVEPELHVTDPAAIEVLWHPDKRIHLKPFLGKACDLAGAAQELAIKKPAMNYWIDRLLEVGLIRQTHVERRTRHRVPFYRCVADALCVGLAEAPIESFDDLLQDHQKRWRAFGNRALAECLARQAPHLEMRLHRSATAGVSQTILPRAEAQLQDDFILYWSRLWLTREENAQLQAELNALWDKYAALSNEQAKSEQVLMHLMHVPEARRT
jgi:hypothetical protein